MAMQGKQPAFKQSLHGLRLEAATVAPSLLGQRVGEVPFSDMHPHRLRPDASENPSLSWV